MLAVYLDESGSHPASPALTVGGYIADAEKWLAFLPAWAEAMKSYGIKSFHMAPCAAGTEQFHGWGRVKCQQRASFLCREILNKHMMASVAVSIRKAVYNTACGPLEDENVGGIYTLATLACMKLAKDWAVKRGFTEPISYSIEAGGAGSEEVLKTVKYMLLTPGVREQHMVHELVARTKIDFPHLQAADIVAHQVNRTFRKTNTLPRDRVSLVDQLRKRPFFWKTLKKSEISAYARRLTRASEAAAS